MIDLSYTTPEEYLTGLKEKLEEALMDLALLKQKAIKNDCYPTAAKYRDIEYQTIRFLNRLKITGQNWS